MPVNEVKRALTLSIVHPLDVLRQRVWLANVRKQAEEKDKQVILIKYYLNKMYLKGEKLLELFFLFI